MSNRGSSIVKNRAPAPIQISAEQILREAADRQEPHQLDPVVQIHDAEEYQSYLRDRRKHFEDNIRYRREHIGNWVKYARLEEEHSELERARSIFERALEVDGRSGELWLRYAEMEMRNECINHARNVLDRAVQLLPRIDFLWYKYVYMEELVGDIPKCRAVFERWMKWMPDDNAWMAYARFETRQSPPEPTSSGTTTTGSSHHSADRAEAVMRRYVNTYPSAKAFLKFAKWAEFEARHVELARTIHEATLSELEPEESRQALVFQRFASFEERQGEYERARVIYQHAIKLFHLENSHRTSIEEEEDVPDWERQRRSDLYQSYLTFEKKHGDRQGIESVLVTRQRTRYQQLLEANPHDYDTWFEYIQLEEETAAATSKNHRNGVADAVRDVYERAVAQIPPSSSATATTSKKKDHWRRYIYLWIYYAVYEELTNGDLDRAARIYETCLQVIPHRDFTFSKIWIYAAQVYVRQKNLIKARKTFGRAIGLCGKERIFQEYISLELSLGEIDRCRAIYNNYLKAMPSTCNAWSKYAALEQSLGETERCRALYELAVNQPALDMPEVLWKQYIDFEMDEGEGDKARALYQRLLERTSHVKVWISYAQFEATPIGRGIEQARTIFQQAYQQLKEQGLKEERVLLLDAWRVLEKEKGTAETLQRVEQKLPRRIKRKRMRQDNSGWEEYFDYQFPDDPDAASGNLKILELAAKWKQQQQQQQQDNASDSDNDDDDDDDDNDSDDDDNMEDE